MINRWPRRPPIIRKPQRPRGKPVTVCIAAACDDGRLIVSATDGRLTFGDIAGDVMAAKMVWFNDWQFMYAGEPSNAQMIFEAMHDLAKGKSLTRANIKKLASAAFKKRMADRLSDLVLSPYDMTMVEFKKEGLQMFGPAEFARLSKMLQDEAYNYTDQILVTGWGKTEFASMLYQVSSMGDLDAKYEGIAAIGSGRNVALSTLLLLKQSRQSSLLDTIYNVAAAKFSSEKSYGQDVGESTSMFVQWKRTPADDKDAIPGKWLLDSDIQQLREIWDEFGKPRFPEFHRKKLLDLVNSVGIKLSTVDQIRTVNSLLMHSGNQQSDPQRSSGQQ